MTTNSFSSVMNIISYIINRKTHGYLAYGIVAAIYIYQWKRYYLLTSYGNTRRHSILSSLLLLHGYQPTLLNFFIFYELPRYITRQFHYPLRTFSTTKYMDCISSFVNYMDILFIRKLWTWTFSVIHTEYATDLLISFIAEYRITNISHAEFGHSYIFISIRRLLECFTNCIYSPNMELFLELFSMMSRHHFADYWQVTSQFLLELLQQAITLLLFHCIYMHMTSFVWRRHINIVLTLTLHCNIPMYVHTLY